MKLRRMFLVFVSLCICISFTNVFNVSAHDYNPKRYWHDLYYNSGMGHTVVRIPYNMNNVSNSNYRQKLTDAIWDWNWHDDGFVELNEASFNVANSDGLVMSDAWESTFPSDIYGKNELIYSYSTIYFNDVSQSCGKIKYCKIYVNIAKCTQDNFTEGDKAYTWLHEIGHAMGLKDTNDGTQSSMRQGKASIFGWSEYWLPQPHDISDLYRYTNASWY